MIYNACDDSEVSIHAPAWGATIIYSEEETAEAVSIHAPAWGATPTSRLLTSYLPCFNPRARVGRD